MPSHQYSGPDEGSQARTPRESENSVQSDNGSRHDPGETAYSGDGTAQNDEMPRWSGDGRNSYRNPMMPFWDVPGAGLHNAASGDGTRNVTETRSRGVAGAGDIILRVNASSRAPSNTATVHPARKPANAQESSDGRGSVTSETWKLVCLVVVFLVWISTASTLLFLYMDRYLFPG